MYNISNLIYQFVLHSTLNMHTGNYKYDRPSSNMKRGHIIYYVVINQVYDINVKKLTPNIDLIIFSRMWTHSSMSTIYI